MVVICVVLSMVRFSCWSIMVVVIMLVHHGGRIVRGFMLMRDGGCHRDGRYVVSGDAHLCYLVGDTPQHGVILKNI